MENKNFDIRMYSFMSIEEKAKLPGRFEHFYLKKVSSYLSKCEKVVCEIKVLQRQMEMHEDGFP